MKRPPLCSKIRSLGVPIALLLALWMSWIFSSNVVKARGVAVIQFSPVTKEVTTGPNTANVEMKKSEIEIEHVSKRKLEMVAVNNTTRKKNVAQAFTNILVTPILEFFKMDLALKTLKKETMTYDELRRILRNASGNVSNANSTPTLAPTVPEPEIFPTAAMQFIEGVVSVCASVLAVFYFYQSQRGKASVEAVYISAVTALLYFTKLFSGETIYWVGTMNGLVPLGRYFSWLLTCPVILAQFLKLHGAAGYTSYQTQLNFLIILEQIMIVCGAFASVSTATQKWLFFVLGIAAGGTFFIQIYFVYFENRRNLPEDIKLPTYFLTLLFIVSWLSYAGIWVLGPPGLGLLSRSNDVIAHAAADIVTKIFFPLVCWYIRWVYLDDDAVTNTGRILVSRKVNGTPGNKFGLTDEEVLNAQTTPFHVLLIDKDILVHKVMLLMMEEVGVHITIAFDTIHALEHLENNPSYLFDCVLVVPNHHKTPLELHALKDLSQLIVRDPYKIPMLAMYFDLGQELADPGDFIHGIIQRPLDEQAFFQDLYSWRLTASMWRRVALTMENIESDTDLFPKLEDLPEEAQNAMMTSSMNVRRRGSLFGQTLFNQQGTISTNQTNDGQMPPQAQQQGYQAYQGYQAQTASYRGGNGGANAPSSTDEVRWRQVLSNYNKN